MGKESNATSPFSKVLSCKVLLGNFFFFFFVDGVCTYFFSISHISTTSINYTKNPPTKKFKIKGKISSIIFSDFIRYIVINCSNEISIVFNTSF